MINFGVGQLLVIPPGANPTPVQFGVLQDVSVDISFEEKELYGSYQFAVDSARAKGKLTGTFKFADVRASVFNQVLTGSTVNSGQTAGAINEAGVIPATPFTIPVAQSATWVADSGVVDLTSGLTMTRVASGPTTGQYSVSAGVYLFAAADTGHSVLISYAYTLTTGKTTSYTNQLMGSGTQYQMLLFNIFRAKAFGIKLWAVTVPKLSLPTKNDDYTIEDAGFTAFADSQTRIIDLYTPE